MASVRLHADGQSLDVPRPEFHLLILAAHCSATFPSSAVHLLSAMRLRESGL